ncbi:hypothetical protein [Nonomuraea guangzhouensis]|uniref:Uncharacterized protein n=1 Tax=Nonomuraea guangzhouensis TaxID=1291555 RepID=A0ABW4GHK8_9ACTN|nr:hypothetical protein [Nonomuraea guangzhouensis]
MSGTINVWEVAKEFGLKCDDLRLVYVALDNMGVPVRLPATVKTLDAEREAEFRAELGKVIERGTINVWEVAKEEFGLDYGAARHLVWVALENMGMRVIRPMRTFQDLDAERAAEFKAELTKVIESRPAVPTSRPKPQDATRQARRPQVPLGNRAVRVPPGSQRQGRPAANPQPATDPVERSEKALRLEREILQIWERLMRRRPQARHDGVAWLTGASGMERFQVAFAKSVRDWIAHPQSRQPGRSTLKEARDLLFEMERRLPNQR